MKRQSFFVLLALITGLIFTLSSISAVCAQEANSDEFTLEEITVTAQKRTENQQKVAIPMEVISGDDLAVTGKTNVDDILGNISNVIINNAPDGMRVAVRGLADENSTFHDMHVSSPAVAINIDGAFNSSSSAGQNLFDVERVEVLMGPQSTLYASTSPGGIVNVVTSAPNTDKFSATASLEAGNFGLFKGQAMVNAPIVNEKLAMRLAYSQQKRDSYYEGTNQTGEDSRAARLKTLWQPNDKLSATVTLNYSKRINGGMMGGQVQAFDTPDGYWYAQQGQDGPWVKGNKVTNPWTPLQTTGGGGPGGPPGAPEGANTADSVTKGITGEVNWDTGIGSLSIVPQYSKTASENKGTYTDTTGTWMVFRTNAQKQSGVEARMSSDKDFFFQWILGVNYYKDISFEHSTYSNPAEAAQTRDAKQDTHAFFGNITYPFTDKFRGTAGYRRSWDESSMIELPPMEGTGPNAGHSGQNYSNPDYKLGVEYDLASNSMLYATYATSYRVNAMAVSQGSGHTIPPEQLKAYSVGAKNRFLGNTLQLNAAAYYYDYSNKSAQVVSDGRLGRDAVVYEDELRDPDGNLYDFNADGIVGNHALLSGANASDPWIQQFGAFRSIGVDISADWVLSAKDRVSLGLSYLNAEWSDLTMDFFMQKADGTHFWPNDGRSFNGATNTNSPTYTVTASYEHDFELGSFGTLVPHADIIYKDSYVLDLAPINYPLNYQESYYIINGNIAFTSASGRWSVNAYIKNATNYAAKNFWMNMAGTASLGITDPRTYGAVLSMKF
jgi:iron complex outermembrane recepter protein